MIQLNKETIDAIAEAVARIIQPGATKRYINAKEAAEMLCVSVDSIRRYSVKLPGKKFGEHKQSKVLYDSTKLVDAWDRRND